MTTPFGERLAAATDARGRLCVGIDPHASLLRDWGLDDNPAGLERFARTAVEAVAGVAAVIKPQSAFFERHGSRGVAVLEQVIADARSAGAMVLVDAKRGDIGSTMAAYADAYLDPSSPLCGDAVTASPYLGFGSIQPMIDLALKHGTGVFVLALTSNPEGAEVQLAAEASGRTVAGSVLDRVRDLNAGSSRWGSFGCVVGATIEPTTENLVVHGPLLAPGVGAQGGRPEDLAAVFGPALPDVLPAVSRSVLAAGPDPGTLTEAARRTVDDVNRVFGNS